MTHLKTPYRAQLHLAILLGLASATILPTLAEALQDPTAPPAALNSAPGVSNVPTAPVLQSVMIGPQIHAAIINGEKVLLGEKYQSATLIKLNAHKAVLQNPDMTTQTLTMDYPIEKKLNVAKKSMATKKLFKRKVKHRYKPTVISEKS